MTTTSVEKVNGTPMTSPEPRFDPVALAEAEAIRERAAAEARALELEAQGKADAAKITATEEAERLRIANVRARMKLEKDRVSHDRYVAEQNRKTAEENAAARKAEKAEAEEAEQEAAAAAEQQRSENLWKWGARGIYIVGLIIAAPVQFLHFWDKARPFLIAAPALLEGLALVLAAGAAWAVAHRRDVLPYRIGIMFGALIAAGINMYGGLSDERIGFNAGLIGTIASLGGPIVLMAYEHGIAQKADGVPSFRERRAEEKKRKAEEAQQAKDAADKAAAAAKKKADEDTARLRAAEEQARKDADRKQDHPEVWAVADSLRSARGSQYVTEQIWAEAWYRVTGSKVVGVDPALESTSRAAQARMKVATDVPIIGDFSLVESQKAPRPKRDPNAVDKRRFNGGTPPRRTPGDTPPYSAAAKKQAALEQAASPATNEV
ncbi:hypothetical protein [Streptomyces odontomachi]|uniref:hypothetical protein n=1 Tax=Streptomyces odontomachi TaxID=2944940 RepID=UPI00210BA084|nr:hypothetical protein [Streptomyces sp. ODS25]